MSVIYIGAVISCSPSVVCMIVNIVQWHHDFNYDIEHVVLEVFMDPRAVYDGLCKEILTGPAIEIMTERGITDFLDGLFTDGTIQNMVRGWVTICVGSTRIWLLYLKQMMKIAEEWLIEDHPMTDASQTLIKPHVTRETLADIGRKLVKGDAQGHSWEGVTY